MLLVALSVLLTYAACETIATWLYLQGRLEPTARRVHERTDPAGNVRVDRLRGYSLSPVPARLVVVTSYGEVVSRGTLRGNNHGFGDQHDFTARRASEQELRFAVLGDSYTAEPFIETDWPDRVEELLAGGRPKSVRLFNRAVDGGGLANWWSILHNWLPAQEIELDGLIFAVASDDLQRRFFWSGEAESRGAGAPGAFMRGGYHSTWDPRSDPIPGHAEGPAPEFDPKWPVVRPGQFDRILAGTWLPPKMPRPFKLYLGTALQRVIGESVLGTAHADARSGETAEESQMRRRLIDDIRKWLVERGLRALVLDINADDHGRRFAADIGADYFPFGFGSSDPDSHSDRRIPYEGHWSQLGSDEFAGNIAPPIYEWATHPAAR